MIEMRWIFVNPGSGRGLVTGSDGQMIETVLQYRESRGYNLDQVHYEVFDGVEWKDVQFPKWP